MKKRYFHSRKAKALLCLFLTLVVTGAVATAVGPASAPAHSVSAHRAHARPRLAIGISDNSPEIFRDPRFHWLGMRYARLVVAWNVVKRPAELGWQAAWLERAKLLGVRPLVVFEKDPRHPTQLPHLSAYGAAVKSFMKLFPWVRDYSPWNEENHYLQPTARDPQRAAEYFNLLTTICRPCKITAADVLDISNMSEWVGRFLHFAHHPRFWGLHNYADLATGSHERTAQFLAMVPGAVWFTETGGVVWRYEHANSGHGGYFIDHGEYSAAQVAGNLLSLAHISSRVTRVYYYQWRVPHSLNWAKVHGRLSWDSGIIRPDCSLRPALGVIARAMGKSTSRVPRYTRGPEGICI